MLEPRGLQIDLQCIQCGRPPTADIPLFEMQNHLHICNLCRIKEEQSGKRIAWVNGLQLDMPTQTTSQGINNSSPSDAENKPETPARTGIFATLEVSEDASPEEVAEGIKTKMRYWMRQPASSEKDQTIEQLREWQQEIHNDTQFLTKQRTKQNRTLARGSALQIGEIEIYTTHELVAACEQSREGWSSGERYLRSGELEYWLYSQTGNRVLAEQVHKMSQSPLTSFQELNSLLYILARERPFRLYTQDAWEEAKPAQTATTPAELARLSDLRWVDAKKHLYYGAMLLWLEYSQGSRGLITWYTASIKEYWRDYQYQGLGLELLLEKAVPTLLRPKLVITFDDSQDEYVLEDWDKEIPHQSLQLKINNETRGATIVNVELVKSEQSGDIDWLYLEGTRQKQSAPPPPPGQPAAEASYKIVPLQIYNRPGEKNPVVMRLFLQGLQELDHDTIYIYSLKMSSLRESQQPSVIREFPITLHTMPYRAGFRRQLWKWGLRGQLPGLCWNFLAGAVLAFILLQLASAFLPNTNSTNDFQLFLATIKETLVFYLNLKFVLISATISGFVGLCVGVGKGHASYPKELNAKNFRKGSFSCILLFLIGLLFLLPAFRTIANANYHDTSMRVLSPYLVGMVIGIASYLITWILSLFRSLTEILLRKQNVELLQPQGCN